LLNRLYQYAQTNNILAPEQFGFRKGSHIEKAIFSVKENILTSLNQREQVGGIFCDLTKAFDCVNHEILLAKLHYYGIRGVSANWFKTGNKRSNLCHKIIKKTPPSDGKQ
jgi:hypothetical protein